jgi:hypothetical protein
MPTRFRARHTSGGGPPAGHDPNASPALDPVGPKRGDVDRGAEHAPRHGGSRLSHGQRSDRASNHGWPTVPRTSGSGLANMTIRDHIRNPIELASISPVETRYSPLPAVRRIEVSTRAPPAGCRRRRSRMPSFPFRQRTASTRARAPPLRHAAADRHDQRDDAVDPLGALVLGGLQVAGGVLGNRDVVGKTTLNRDLCLVP